MNVNDYYKEDGEPIKCYECSSVNFEHQGDEIATRILCSNCDEELGFIFRGKYSDTTRDDFIRVNCTKPKMVENPDLSKLKASVCEYMDWLYSWDYEEGSRGDHEAFLYNVLIETLYGEEVFKKLNAEVFV